MIRLATTLLAFLAASGTGCAAIFQGADAEIAITSNVEGATILVNGDPRGTTAPAGEVAKIKVPRATAGMVIQKPGYEPVSVQLDAGLDIAWLVLDVLLGIIPLIVDLATGAWNGVTPDRFHAELQKVD